MFWDKISPLYDLFENVYNGRVYEETGRKVAEFIDGRDTVLECACGTGAISAQIAKKCKRLIATDYSDGMLKEVKRKCGRFPNVTVRRADITSLNCRDGRFDKVVAGNVIHLLPDPAQALNELMRVTKRGGKVIIPTYINNSKKSAGFVVKVLKKLGADFKRQFNFDSYRKFFDDCGAKDVEYIVVDGRMPCAIAVITRK